MRDRDVRDALWQKLEAEHAGTPDTLMMDEVGLCHGDVRVDVFVANGELCGFEIKSDRDTLERLPRQIEAYSDALDKATIVVGERHAEKVRPMVRPWWGITVATSTADGEVVLRREREAQMNPELSPVAVAELLWRDEALALLERLNQAKGIRSKPRLVLYSKLAEVLSIKELREEVRSQLKRRNWRSDARRT